MSDAPLIPASLYGLRTWRLAVDAHGEYLRAAARPTRWPADDTWLNATCGESKHHAAPSPECSCGIHAWHPRRSTARRVLASRFEVPGIVEAAGAIELQHDGFRAERARPYAFVVTPGRNLKLAERLARRHRAEVVEVAGADALVAWCRERGLGLDERTVDRLLGPERAEERQRARRRRLRRDVLRGVAAAGLVGALLLAGGAFATGAPSPHGIAGRTGWVKRPDCQHRPGAKTAPATPRKQGC